MEKSKRNADNMNEIVNIGILEDATKKSLEKLVGKIFALAVQLGKYEFVPGYFLCDSQYLIKAQESETHIKNIKDIDFSVSDFWILGTPPIEHPMETAIAPCRDPLDIAEVILMTGGMGTEEGEYGTDQ